MNAIQREIGSTWRAIGIQAQSVLAGTFLMNTGSYLVLPIWAIYMRDWLALSSTEIAVALTTKLWAQEGLGIFGGALADKWGWRPLLISGSAIRLAGFILLAESTTAGAITVAALLLGMGAAIYLPAAKTALSLGLSAELRIMAFALRTLAANAGVALGPLIGVLFVGSPRILFFLAAFAYLTFAVLIAIEAWLPNVAPRVTLSGNGSPLTPKLSETDTRLIVAALVGSFAGGLFLVQLDLSLAVLSFDSLGHWGPTVLFSANAVIVVLGQAPVGLILARGRKSALMTGVAFCMFCICFSILAIMQFSFIVMIAAVVSFTIGEIMLFPLLDSMVARAVPTTWLGKGFGAISAAYALGGAAGNAIYAHVAAGGISVSFGSVWGLLALLAFASAVLLSPAGFGVSENKRPTSGDPQLGT
jgi:MFS transporter, DHA1 family, multidrug resistance protein